MIQRMREPLSLRLVVVSGFALLALVHGVVLALVAAAREQPLLPASLVGVANAAVWLAITPLVVWCTRAVRDRHVGTLARVAIHVVGAAALAVPTGIVHATLAAASGIRPAIPLPAGVLYHFDLNIAIYVCIVLITHALDRSAAVILVRRRVLALERSLSDARVDFLTRQLRPHMLFNCLNAIAQLAIEAPVAAARMLSELANFIGAWQFARRGTLPLRDEIAITERYLALEQVRFADRLQTHIDVEPAALEARVPPLILQPLVENSVRHGVARREGATRIAVRASVRHDRLVVTIVDSGDGLRASGDERGLGIGTANTRERLSQIYGDEYGFTIEERPNETVVELALPLQWQTDDTDAALVAPEAPAVVLEVSTPSSPDRRRLTLLWSVPLLFAVIAVLQSTQIYLYTRMRPGPPVPFVVELIANGSWAATWVLLTALVMHIARWIPIRQPRAALKLLLHAACAVVIALLSLAPISWWIVRRPLFHFGNLNAIVINLLVYTIILIAVHLRQLRQWLEERQVSAARISAALAEERWRATTIELQPARLVVLLRSIEDQLATNPELAERRVVQLAETLHTWLRERRPRESSLAEELANLEVSFAGSRSPARA